MKLSTSDRLALRECLAALERAQESVSRLALPRQQREETDAAIAIPVELLARFLAFH